MKLSPEILARQIEMLVSLRQAWNRADSPTADSSRAADAPLNQGRYGGLGEERATSSWSA